MSTKAQSKQELLAQDIGKAFASRWLWVLEKAIVHKEYPFGYTKSTSDKVLQNTYREMDGAIRAIYAYPHGSRASRAVNEARDNFNKHVGERWQKLQKIIDTEDANREANTIDLKIKDGLKTKVVETHNDYMVELALRNACEKLGASSSEVIRATETLELESTTCAARVNELVNKIMKETANETS